MAGTVGVAAQAAGVIRIGVAFRSRRRVGCMVPFAGWVNRIIDPGNWRGFGERVLGELRGGQTEVCPRLVVPGRSSQLVIGGAISG